MGNKWPSFRRFINVSFLSRVTKFSSHVCAVPYYERGRRVSPRNQHRGPVVGCAIWTWRIVEERGKLCSKEKKGRRRARCPVKSQGVVVVLVPYYDSQCFSWPLRNFLFFLLHPLLSPSIHIYRPILDAKATISRFENIVLFTIQSIFTSQRKIIWYLETNFNNKYCRTKIINYYKFLRGDDN